MVQMNGIKNFLKLINENWTLIIAVFGLVYGIYKKVAVYFGKTREEQVIIAKAQIREFILKLVSDAEDDYLEWDKAGAIKRAQVIKQIYEKYPILNHVEDQETLVRWIDTQINTALETLREIIEKNDFV